MAGPAPWSCPTRRRSCATPIFRWSSNPDMAGAAGGGRGGPRALVYAAAAHEVEWRWIEGHAGHAKNEYADVLATSAAERQARSNGLVPSAFDTWLAQERARGRYADYDPDQELHERL